MRDTLEALEKGMVCIAGRNDKETKRREEERRKGQRQRAGREGAAPRIEGDSRTSSDIEEGVQRALRELNF